MPYRGNIYRRKYGSSFLDPNDISDPHVIFSFPGSKAPLTFVGTFGVFRIISVKADLALRISRSYFFKSTPRTKQISVVNLKFTGFTYSPYLCINMLLMKFSLQNTSSFQFSLYPMMQYPLVFHIIQHSMCLRSETISDHPFRKRGYP